LETLYDNKYPFPQKYEYELDFYLVNKKLVNIYEPYITKLNQIQHELNVNTDSIDKLNDICSLNNKQILHVTDIIKSDLTPCIKCANDHRIGVPCCYDKTRKESACYLHRSCKIKGCDNACRFGDLYCSVHKK
jgi:hypothetical protein